MATKTRRLEARTDEDTYEMLVRAAEAEHETVSAFVVDAARGRAERVIARSDVTLMPNAEFDEMMAALSSAPRVIPALREAASRPRRFARATA
jgi:uncharacterized protein (DUF1778 family)